MAIETEIAVAARDALPPFTSQASANQAGADHAVASAAPAAPEEGVTLTLSSQGRLLAALAGIVDSAAADADALAAVAAVATDAVDSAGPATPAKAAKAAEAVDQPITRATLYAIEARLVAARRGADAVQRADSELPPSDDPARLAQARQATESLYGRAANPFTRLSRAQLSAIVYDESGAYTVNERYAAANQRTEQDQRFWAPVFQRALGSGDWRPVIEAALVFYAALSPLEQTAYPANYAQLMRQYLALYNLQPQAPLPPQQQADLQQMMTALALPSGPLALAGGVIRGLVLPRAPSLAELVAAAPHLADLVQVSNLAHSVQDSAYLVLLQRVFGVGRREDEPPVARRNGNAAAPARDYLFFGDRRYLADAYAYAQENGIAPEEVDALVADLAAYRQARTAGAQARDGLAQRAAVAGTAQVSQRPHADEMAAAQRILSSRAARDTRLDHGFLAWLLDPAGWSEQEGTLPAVRFSALERLLAGLAGVGIGERAGDDSELEPGYRYALYRIGLQEEAAEARPPAASADAARNLTLAAQMAALARAEASDLAFMNNALMLLKMYRFSLRMSDVEQRTLAELVYSSLRKRRLRPRRGKLFVLWGERSPSMPSLPG